MELSGLMEKRGILALATTCRLTPSRSQATFLSGSWVRWDVRSKLAPAPYSTPSGLKSDRPSPSSASERWGWSAVLGAVVAGCITIVAFDVNRERLDLPWSWGRRSPR